MDIRYLKTFKTIVEEGSFTKASEKLGYTQSSITTHISNLEKELGIPIFDRLGKNVYLNEYGKLLLPYAINVLDITTSIKETFESKEDVRGDLRIGAPEAVLTYRLPLMMKDYKTLYPKVNIFLEHLDPKELKSKLCNGELDFGFIITDKEPTIKDLNFQKIFNEPLSLLSYKPINKNNIFDSLNDTLLLTENGCIYRDTLENLVESFHISSPHKITLESIETIKQCVISELGISVLPNCTVNKEILENTIYNYPLNNQIYTFLAIHKNKTISPSMNSFINILKNHIHSKNNLYIL